MSLDFSYLGLGRELIDYQRAWDLQRQLHGEVVRGARPDTVLILEHTSVYTAGKRTEPGDRPIDGTPVIEVDRGGKITWHGPGQLVGYPIIRLPEPVGVVDYVRRLEEAMIRTFADLELTTGRVAGRSGVWLAAEPSGGSGPARPERKVAAIGVRVAGGVTMHGFAINVDPDLDWFSRIVPCGITDAGVTSLAAELDDPTLSLHTVAHVLRPHLEDLLAFQPYEKSRGPAQHRPARSDVRHHRLRLDASPHHTPGGLPMSVITSRRAIAIQPEVEYAIEAYDLRKSYRTRKGRRMAVDGLDLKVPLGGVHGFLGPNGSGKTTTIRMLLGLITADHGFIQVFDQEVPTALPRVINRIGAIVEQPKFFPNFSGGKNLGILATGIGVRQQRVAEVLAEVGLGDRGRDKFRTYSLGMKQRLAIAATLLKDPDLLIFDEPTNGLDPAGIHEIRATMRGLADRGKTVLVSSHILAEVQLVADTVSIIGRGRLLAEGEVKSILEGGAGNSTRVVIGDPERATTVLRESGLIVLPQPDRSLLVSSSGGDLRPSVITRLLADQRMYVSELTPVRRDLESVFLELTAEEHLGAQPVDGAPSAPRTARRGHR